MAVAVYCGRWASRLTDTGAWDSFGEDGKREYFKHIAAGNPTARIGCRRRAVRMTDTIVTGMTLKVDGGEPAALALRP